MPTQHSEQTSIPQGMTPLVSMFPLHIGESAPAGRTAEHAEPASDARSDEPGRAAGSQG